MDQNTTIKWVLRHPSDPIREQNKETRIYGAMNGALAPAAIEAMEQWTWPNVESVTYENRDTDEAKRIMAGYRRTSRAAIAAVRLELADLLRMNGVEVEPGDLHFSQKAGCGCGCSPGWILRGHRIRREGKWGYTQPVDGYLEVPKSTEVPGIPDNIVLGDN